MNDTSFDFRRPADPPKAKTAPASEPSQSAAEATGSLNITLHPLVIINISDHFTRFRAQSGGASAPAPRVFGVLLGEQLGRAVEIANSFELKMVLHATGTSKPDPEYLKIRLEQYKKTFPKYDMLGWYSTSSDGSGGGVMEGDLDIHRGLCEREGGTGDLLYLVLDPHALVSGNRDLPIGIHETEIHVVDDTPTLRFAPKVAYKIDSIESERIAVDHVAHILPSGDSNSSSALAQQLGTQYTAMAMLSERIDVLQKYLKAVSSGEVPADHELLRQIKSLCGRLPALDSPQLHEDFLRDYNNTLLVTYLGCVTKGTGAINDVIDKYNTAFDKHSRRRGIF